jgi:hypothetical protein
VNLDMADSRIPQLLRRWEELKPLLAKHFENRETEKALVPMGEGIEIFLNFLYLTNDMQWDKQVASIMELQWKPVNVIERISFIKKRPNLFHSFIQLSELISEQEKQYNKKIAIKKMTKQ